jgi:hypothetical protein
MLISALGELAVESAHIVTSDGGHRQAVVVVGADDAGVFAGLLPRASCVRRTSRGTSVFRLLGLVPVSRAAASAPARRSRPRGTTR